jgi:ABC-type phosphate transport system permease subunit
VNRRPQLKIIAPSASPEEAAAVVAALERFMRETAPVVVAVEPAVDAWTRTALLEGVSREDEMPAAWGDPHPWGR